MIKNFSMVLDFVHNLKNNLHDVNPKDIYIMSLYSYERMWQLFLSGLATKNEHLLLKKFVRNGLDILWKEIISDEIIVDEYKIILSKIDVLNSKNELSEDCEELYDGFFNQFPPYLINELYSNIISLKKESKYYSCVVSTLMMLSDLAEDNKYDEHSEALVNEEAKRIYDDMEFLNNYGNNIYMIIERKIYYQKVLLTKIDN